MLKADLASHQFVTTMEIDPPRGANPWLVYEQIKQVVPLLTAVNIADSPTAKLRMSPIALAHLIQAKLDLETIFHLTCRDRNLLGLQSELLGAYALDVRNILTITGDAPTLGDHPQATGVFDVDAVGLAKMANNLNRGQDFMGNALSDATDFFIGGVANPVLKDVGREMARIAEKIANGVAFFQTQPIYSLDQLENFQKVAPKNVPFIYGIMPLKGAKQAHYLNNNVPGVHVPEGMITCLEKEGRLGGLKWIQDLIKTIRPEVAGIHIFPMGDYTLVEQLLGEAL